MSMKKMLALLLALAMVFALAACASGDAGKDDGDKETTAATTTTANKEPAGEDEEPVEDDVPVEDEPVEDDVPVEDEPGEGPIERPMPGAPATVESVVAFVEGEGGKAFLEGLEEGFTSGGMTCNSTMEAVGSGVSITICINEMDEVDAETSAAMQATYDEMGEIFQASLEQLQKVVPELTFLSILVCDVDGDILATVYVGE